VLYRLSLYHDLLTAVFLNIPTSVIYLVVRFSDSASDLFFLPLPPAGVTSIFNGLLHNHTRFPSATTTIGELLAHDQRLLASVADYDNVTSGHPDAKDYMNEDVR
jgi:hypothetical protein